ncbi:MAG: TolC family protein [Desulfuromonadales bacterium]|nr:TolC family protein [Desulfuromonadales bacterium]MDT8444205.1 TolC family protein [Desulfuromonadales bacterium]
MRYLILPLLTLLMTMPAESLSALTLQAALARGLAANLDLRIAATETPISAEQVIIADAIFDAHLEVEAETTAERIPTASVFTSDSYDRLREYTGLASLSKRFRTGLEGNLSLEAWRRTTNSSVTGLDPQYRSYLTLDLVQPLLRDAGTGANTADLRIARQLQRQAGLAFLDQARILGGKIEQGYIEISRSYGVLAMRRLARSLAEDILAGNRRKFEAGLIPVSEVQEAETAVAAREEEVLLASQQVEVAVNNLRDLLEMEQLSPSALSLAVNGSPADVIEPLERGEALALALDNRPDLEGQRVELAVRDIRVAFAENQELPRLDLAATLGANGLSGSAQNPSFTATGAADGSNPFLGGYEESLSRMAEADGYEWAVGLVFSQPLGNRAAEARTRQAKLRKRQAIDRLRRLENQIATEVDNALTILNRSLERVAVSDRFVALAKTTLDQEMERLKAGLSDTFRILDFQEELIAARIRRINAMADTETGQADLYAAVGLNLERHGILPVLPAAD